MNPFGGKKSAVKILYEQVKPLLEDAQIELTIQGDRSYSSTQLCFVLFGFFVDSVFVVQKLNISSTPRRLLVRWILQSTMELFVLVEMEFWLRLVSLSSSSSC